MKKIVRLYQAEAHPLAHIYQVAVLLLLMSASAHAQHAFISPVYRAKVSHPFNDRNAAAPGKYHAGADYSPTGGTTLIVASNIGVIHSITQNGRGDHGLGNCIILKHAVPISSNGKTHTYYTLYGHLASIAKGIRVGSVVSRGQTIGIMGGTGYNSTNKWEPHLHFEVKTAGVLHNPYGSGMYWGYTPKNATLYGYVDPASVIGSWTALPLSR